MSNQKRAFTLVELIVSIAILAILGTIAVISLQSYSRSARDSVRITDLSNIKTSLELFHIETGKFPLTTDGYNVTYGGGNVWEQGIFGKQTFNNISRLDKIPLDPLTLKEYTYSLINTKQEYELAGIMEGESLALNNVLGNKVNAAEQIMSVMVTGNYNGEMLNVTKLGTLCVVAVPSIITSSGTTLESIVPNNYFVYNNYTNLPSNYNTNTKFKLLGETDLKLVNELNIDLYCGDFSILNTNESVRLDFIENFQKAYTGTQVEVSGRIMEVLELTIDKTNPTPALKIYTIDLVEQVFVTTISNEQKESASECNIDYHFEGLSCISNTKIVSITNGVGTQTWNGTSWDSVVFSSCNPTFHTEDNTTCISNTKSASVTNGTGEQLWSGSNWGSTIILSCDNGYSNNGISCIQNTWNMSIYGSCSVTCGGGTQSRTVQCKNYLGTTILDSNCLGVKPSSTQNCNTQSCATSGPYSYGSWGTCSKTCDGGTQTRSQSCNYDSCYSPQATSQSCNTQACPLGCSAGAGPFINCTVSRPSAAHGGVVSVSGGGVANGYNRNGGGTGTCNNGTWVNWSLYCTQGSLIGANCPGGSTSYLGCTFSRGVFPHGGTLNVSNNNSGHSGQIRGTCNNGTWVGSGYSCAY